MTELNVDDLKFLDDPYMHATCDNVHPQGSLHNLDIYNALCGKQAVMLQGVELPKCPDCVAAWNKIAAGAPCHMCQ